MRGTLRGGLSVLRSSFSFFQSLENHSEKVPIIGNFSPGFSNHWKKCGWLVLAAVGILVAGARAQSCTTLAEATHAPAFTWTTGGDADWFAQTNTTREPDSCAAQSGATTNNGANWMETVVTGRGLAVFQWKVSSEEGYDDLTFYINGSESNVLSGDADWQQCQYVLASNVSTLRWEYSKDISESEGSDAGWMTDFVFVPFTGRVVVVSGELAFGRVAVNTSTQRVITVSSLGDEALTVSDIQVPTGYTVSATNFVLPPESATNVTVTFSPLDGVYYNGTLDVFSDAQAGVSNRPVSGLGLLVSDRFVWTNSPSPALPYTNWATAAHTIQEALDVAGEGDTVWVTNGVYDQGGGVMYDQTNRAMIGTGVVLRSMNGPLVTHIVGAVDPTATNEYGFGPGAVRGVIMDSGAVLYGFTVRGGRTIEQDPGGGVFAFALSGTVVNCVISDNASGLGGGVAGAVCYDSVIESNRASRYGGGAYVAWLNDCVVRDNTSGRYGGGMMEAFAAHCRITGNSAQMGGGAFMAALSNCVVAGNSAERFGGGVARMGDGPIENCTIVGNSAAECGGIVEVMAVNCLVYYNTASIRYPNWPSEEDSESAYFEFSCTTPLPEGEFGTNNIADAPRIVSLIDPHLLSDSPCIDAGTNAEWMATGTDIDGEARLNAGTVDIGADEFWANSLTDTLQVAISLPLGAVVVPGYPLPLEAAIIGRCEQTTWEIDDGTALTNVPFFTHAFTNTGDYEVRLAASNLLGEVSAVVTVRVLEVAFYVATNGSDAADGMSWSTAKQTIQAAVDACTVPGASVWVSNGVYDTGGAYAFAHSNRVAVTNPFPVRSMNGPEFTEIRGAQDPASTNVYGCGSNAVRCVLLSGGASLSGFTLSGGRSGIEFEFSGSGGGVFCDGSRGAVSNCIVVGCAAYGYGGGIYQGVITHCDVEYNEAGQRGGGVYESELSHSKIIGNRAQYGGGMIYGEAWNCLLADNEATKSGGGADDVGLYNCTVIGNRAMEGGGVSHGFCVNTIVYYNEAVTGPNWGNGSFAAPPYFSYSCTTPMPEVNQGGFTNAPLLAGMRYGHLLQNSPCIGAGITQEWMAAATDCDDEPRQNGTSVDIGWDQFWYAGCTNDLEMGIGFPNGLHVAPGAELPMFSDDNAGRPLGLVWHFGDSSSVNNETWPSHAWAGEGEYTVLLTAINQDAVGQAAATVYVENVVQHVTIDGDDSAAGTNWATAKQTIQAAVDDSIYGGLILVSNGVYNTGARQYGELSTSNRVIQTNAVTVRGVNGPAVTIIAGYAGPDEESVRCVLMGPNTRLENMTLTNGYTAYTSTQRDHGGGAYCMDETAVLSNCVISGCNAYAYGGGVYRGTLLNSTLQNNAARHGGGAYEANLVDCTVSGNTARYGDGGGIAAGSAVRCDVSLNVATNGNSNGGGVFAAMVSNCTIRGNACAVSGGGVAACTVYNSLITENVSVSEGGGAYQSNLRNCTMTANSSGTYLGSALNSIIYGNTAYEWNGGSAAIQYTCTTPLPDGDGCITNDPLLTSDYALQAASPCINAGSNEAWMVGAMDLAGTNRLIDTTVDMGAYEYWMGPGNLMATFAGGNVLLTWELPLGVSSCAVYRGDAELPPASPLAMLGSTNRWQDTNALSGECYFYWVQTYFNGESSPVMNPVYYCVPSGPENTHYVWAGSTTPQAPYTNWATAATNIQDAVDVASDGHTVLVGDGTYDTGWRTDSSDSEEPVYLKNRVFITNDITVRSAGGPEKTSIRGEGPNGTNAVRSVYMRGHSILSGFTLSGGHVAAEMEDWTHRNQTGGGVFMEGGAIVSNCVITQCGGSGVANWKGGRLVDSMIVHNAGEDGGGLYLTGEALVMRCAIVDNTAAPVRGDGGHGGGAFLTGDEADGIPVLRNCFIAGNLAEPLRLGGGGGVMLNGGHLVNCTLINNRSMEFGGGIYVGASASTQQVVNCISYHNQAPYGCDVYVEQNSEVAAVLEFNCVSEVLTGSGNITNDPFMVGSEDAHILEASPCRGAGDLSVVLLGETDVDKEFRLGPGITVDIGCDQFHADAIFGEVTPGIAASFTNLVAGVPCPLWTDVRGKVNAFVWRYNAGAGVQRITNAWQISPVFTNAGQVEVVITATNADGAFSHTCTVTVVESFTNYVSLNGAHVAPYTNWANAATNVQSAIDACFAGGVTIVNTGIYKQGSTIRIEKPVTLRGTEDGETDEIELNGENAYGVLFMDHEAAVVENLTLRLGKASQGGGAVVYGGVLRHCTVQDNTAEGFGACVRAFGSGILEDCYIARNVANEYGGGVYADDRAQILRCWITSNTSRKNGGGAWLDQDAVMLNTFVDFNRAFGGGGVAFGAGGTMRNCTVVRNLAEGYGGGVLHGKGITRNSLMYYNEAPVGADNYKPSGAIEVNYCLTTPGVTGTGNITGANPRLASLHNPHILPSSPARNAGDSSGIVNGEVDYDSESRIYEGTVDIGCDEVIPTNLLPSCIVYILNEDTLRVNDSTELWASLFGKPASLVWTVTGVGVTNTYTDQTFITASWSAPGLYPVVLTASNLGGVASATAPYGWWSRALSITSHRADCMLLRSRTGLMPPPTSKTRLTPAPWAVPRWSAPEPTT